MSGPESPFPVQQPATADVPPLSSATPPIVQIFHVATQVALKALSFASLLSSSLWSLFRTAVSPIGAFAAFFTSPILYLLGPVIVLATILVDLFVVSPYNLFIAGAKAVYPVYVFVGVACICASFVGFCARGVTGALQRWAVGSAEETEEKAEEVNGEVEKVEDISVVEVESSSARRPRRAKKVAIKEEVESD